MNTAAGQLARGCAFRAVLTFALVLGLPVLLFGALALLGGLATILTAALPDDLAPMALGLTMVLTIGGALPVALAPVFAWRLWFERSAFRRFAALGLDGRRMWVSSLQFHGHHDGRVAEAYWYRGPTLEIFVEGQVGARAVVMAVAGQGGLDGLVVQGDDHAWGPPALADAQAALQRLLCSASMTPGQVHVRPDGVLVRWRGPGAIRMPADWLAETLADLTQVLTAAEAHPPSTPRAASSAEAVRGPRWALPGGLWTTMGGMAVLWAGLGGLLLLMTGLLALTS